MNRGEMKKSFSIIIALLTDWEQPFRMTHKIIVAEPDWTIIWRHLRSKMRKWILGEAVNKQIMHRISIIWKSDKDWKKKKKREKEKKMKIEK